MVLSGKRNSEDGGITARAVVWAGLAAGNVQSSEQSGKNPDLLRQLHSPSEAHGYQDVLLGRLSGCTGHVGLAAKQPLSHQDTSTGPLVDLPGQLWQCLLFRKQLEWWPMGPQRKHPHLLETH